MNTNFKVTGLTRLGIKTEFTAPEADALTTCPSDLPNSIVTRMLHCTEAATNHESCCYYYITINELLNHCVLREVTYARGSIGGSAFDIASQRLDGKKKFWSTGLAKMFAGRMFVTSDFKREFL